MTYAQYLMTLSLDDIEAEWVEVQQLQDEYTNRTGHTRHDLAEQEEALLQAFRAAWGE